MRLLDELLFDCKGEEVFEWVGDKFRLERVCERFCKAPEEGALLADGLAG